MMDHNTLHAELRRQSQADTDTRFGSGAHNRKAGLVTMQTIRQRARRRQWARLLWEWSHGRGWQR